MLGDGLGLGDGAADGPGLGETGLELGDGLWPELVVHFPLKHLPIIDNSHE